MAIVERVKSGLESVAAPERRLNQPVLGEALCMLLERADRKLPMLDALLMVSVADHLHLASSGTPISGDDYFAFAFGLLPVNLFLQLFEAGRSRRLWGDRIVVSDDFGLALSGGGDCRSLSKAQRAALNAAFDMVFHGGIEATLEAVSRTCPEWLANQGKLVTLSDALVAFGASRSDADEWAAEVRSGYRQAS